MRKTGWLGTTLLGSFALLSTVVLAKPSSPIPVTTMVEDLALSVAPSLQLQSDQRGTYVNGASGVISVITTAPGYTHRAGDFYMDTGTAGKSPRLIYINFSQPTPTGGNLTGGQANVFPAGLYAGFLKANCDLTGVDLRTLPAQTNGVPTVVTCPFDISFTVSRATYILAMNPGITPSGAVQFPETNNAQITCMAGGTGVCTEFRFDPSGTYSANGSNVEANVARLIQADGSIVTADLGDYYISFEVVVMK